MKSKRARTAKKRPMMIITVPQAMELMRSEVTMPRPFRKPLQMVTQEVITAASPPPSLPMVNDHIK
jgi:hypothetical protein